MMRAGFRQILSVTARLGLLATLLPMAAGCASLLPTTIYTELEIKNPLRGPPGEVQTIAVVLPSSLEAHFNAPDASRGRLDKVGITIGERLEQSGRFKLASAVQYQEALSRLRAGIDVRLAGVPTESERTAAVLAAARQVGADAVLFTDGKWESALVLSSVTLGRPEYRRVLTVTLASAKSGETIWYQEATVTIREGLTTPQEEAIRKTVASDVADNVIETMR